MQDGAVVNNRQDDWAHVVYQMCGERGMEATVDCSTGRVVKIGLPPGLHWVVCVQYHDGGRLLPARSGRHLLYARDVVWLTCNCVQGRRAVRGCMCLPLVVESISRAHKDTTHCSQKTWAQKR